jgi:hypothetical protein
VWRAGRRRRCGPKSLTLPGNPDIKLMHALNTAGVSGEVRRVLDRFLAGVLLDDTGQTSNASRYC